MFTEGGSHARLLSQQGTGIQDNVLRVCAFSFMLCSMTTGPCSQHIVSYIFKECSNIQIDLLYNILYNLY